MNYAGGSDDFVGLADLGAVSVAAAARKCTNAQTAYQKRLATFQKQLSKAKTQAAATRIQNNMQKVMTNLATRAQAACNAASALPPVTPGFPQIGQPCPVGYIQDPYTGQCSVPGGTTLPQAAPTYPGSYVGQVVGVFTWNGYSWAGQQGYPGAAPTFPGTYVNEVVNGYAWNGYSWVNQSSGAAPLNMPPWLQPGGGFGPTYGSPFAPYNPYLATGGAGYSYGGGPLLTPIDEANQYTGAMYASPGYAPQPMYAAAPYGPELTPIDPSDVSMDMPGYDTQAEDLQPNSQAPGFPPSGTGPTQPQQVCSMEAANPATADAYGPLQTIQIVCGGATPASPSQSPTYNGQTITSVEESEIGMMGLGRYLG